MRLVSLLIPVLLIGCDQIAGVTSTKDAPETPPAEVGDPMAAPLADAAVPPPDAAPAAVTAATNTATTIVSLGDPGRSGAWLETPLVSKEQRGEVRYAGRGVGVRLIPVKGGSSRMSLGAMQALGLPLADLTEVEVVY